MEGWLCRLLDFEEIQDWGTTDSAQTLIAEIVAYPDRDIRRTDATYAGAGDGPLKSIKRSRCHVLS